MHLKSYQFHVPNNNLTFPLLGYELLGGAIVVGAILLVAGVRAWRQIIARGENAKDGQQKMKIGKTTEEISAGKGNGKKHESVGLTEQERPLLGGT